MKEEYDFSKSERGKFYNKDAEFALPVHLDPDVARFMRNLADKKGTDVDTLVNDWLRRSIELVRSAE
jgi:hypothetical protein